ncbi:protein of unknown function [Kyrpidia spormannii]|uniref:Cation efflux protein cytoplasmic domain-containing protein n=1 Tax=Kyrpidia spormannii TaxID=2055160 RepID=A0A6F9E2C4_9BACL|nr:protein of unknown function [Kyrpidia spormannii]
MGFGHGHSHHHDGGHSHTHRGVDSSIVQDKEATRVLMISFVGLLVTGIVQAAFVALSGSVALLADTIHNFGDAFTCFIFAITFYQTLTDLTAKQFTLSERLAAPRRPDWRGPGAEHLESRPKQYHQAVRRPASGTDSFQTAGWSLDACASPTGRTGIGFANPEGRFAEPPRISHPAALRLRLIVKAVFRAAFANPRTPSRSFSRPACPCPVLPGTSREL